MNVFLDYQKAILRELERRRLENTLSLRLAHPTPAKIKEECIEVYTLRFQKKDEIALSSFFGAQPGAADYLQAIKRADIDKFRPVINLIKGNVSNPDERNVELLAWLLDFKPRPWNPENTYTEDKPPAVKISENNSDRDVKAIPFAEAGLVAKEKSSATGDRKISKQVIALATVILLLCGAGYFIWNNAIHGVTRQEACMYWNVDHYEQISCNKKMGEAMIIALDTIKLKYFKKIMKEDTITYNSIGKLWYIKINNKPEYFTARGKHPLYPALVLKPITAHIIDTYIKVDSVR